MKRITREQLLLTAGAVLLVIVVGAIGGVVYALMHATLNTLRWWAGLMTVAFLAGVAVAYALGRQAARAHLAGLEQGIEQVTRAASQTVAVAEKAAQVRVGVAQQMRRPQPTPTVQQVFLPGLPAAGGPMILPVASREEEVEL